MPDIADYNGPTTAVIHAEPDSPFAVYLAAVKDDPTHSFRVNVTTNVSIQNGTCLTSQPVSPLLLLDGVENVLRLLKGTSSWPDIRTRLTSMLAD